jgi:hypothetical protein
MRGTFASPRRLAALTCSLCALGLAPATAAEPAAPTQGQIKEELPTLNLLDAVRDGSVSVAAEGTGDGRMTVSVTNRTNRQLRVVLPPGLIASGAT